MSMSLCLGGNSTELGDCCGVMAILGADHTQGVIWSARTALVGHCAEGAQCGTAGTAAV